MPIDTRSSRVDSSDRGQTGVDFLVGAAVFLIAVGFVFAFLPMMFDPFVGTGTSNTLVADRTAAYLVEDHLVDPAFPAMLDTEKTDDFFNGSNNNLGADLGIDTDQVQVQLGNETRGPEPPADGSSIVVSQRLVKYDGAYYRLFVRVW